MLQKRTFIGVCRHTQSHSVEGTVKLMYKHVLCLTRVQQCRCRYNGFVCLQTNATAALPGCHSWRFSILATQSSGAEPGPLD